MSNLRAYMPAVVLFLGCALVWKTREQRVMPLAEPLHSVLPVVPGYRTYDLKISDEERKVAGMTEYVARAFARDSLVSFTTLVSYYGSQSQGKTIHSPRNCLPGAGWEVLDGDMRVVHADGGDRLVNHYTIQNGGATAVVYYWYQGRGRIVASEYAVKWNLLRDAALLGHTEEALVRVLVPVNAVLKPGDTAGAQRATAAANALGAEIAAKLFSEVSRVLPAMPAADRAEMKTASLAPARF